MFGMKVQVTITKDDEPFSATTQEYSNMEYSDVVAVEKVLIGAVAQLAQIAEQKGGKKK